MPSRQQLLDVIRIQAEIAKLGMDLGGVMQYVVEQTLPLLQADGAVIELAEDGDMVYRATAGSCRKQLGLRLKIQGSLSGLCVTTGETLTCSDSETDPRVDREACRRVGLRSMIVLPLNHRDVTVGALKAISSEPGRFTPRDVTLLGMLAEVVAASMYFSVQYDTDTLFIKATHDDMTGLANRALFMDRLRNVVARTQRDRAPSGVLMIDMDGLKRINDSFGHRVGDAVIIEFSARLKQATRSTDTTARLGGDEFGVILTPLETPEGVHSAMQRIDAGLKAPFIFEESPYQLSASIGSALIPIDGDEPHQVLEKADQRMYAVKQTRRGSR